MLYLPQCLHRGFNKLKVDNLSAVLYSANDMRLEQRPVPEPQHNQVKQFKGTVSRDFCTPCFCSFVIPKLTNASGLLIEVLKHFAIFKYDFDLFFYSAVSGGVKKLKKDCSFNPNT